MENKQSILVIDDSPTVRRLAELVLSQEGYDEIGRASCRERV